MKNRHFPDKIQNNYGGEYECPNYDRYYKETDGKEFCHDEGQAGWSEWINWSQTDENGNLKCKGNRHNCFKMRQKWLASLSEKERNNIIYGTK